MERARQLLHETYGFADFRGQQAEVIQALLEGRDTLVLMPTGGGKSLCYQLPALVMDGVALVVSPLIALMQDQVTALRQLGVKAAFLNSSLHVDEERQVLTDIRREALDLVYIAPERLLQPRTLDLLKQANLALIAVDEAHCVSQWGHDFRADYLNLDCLAEVFPGVPRLALTATADDRTRGEIISGLKLSDPAEFVSSFDRPNIRYSVRPKNQPKRQLLNFLKRHAGEAGIVYCLSRRKVDATADWLNSKGFTALPYHAGLNSETRARNQEQFLREDAVIMVATIAFGMGIDKPDVRFVAHLDLPKSIEAYYQETGRAGRDGLPSEAWMVYGLQDVVQMRQLLGNSDASDARKLEEVRRLDALLGWCEVTGCRRRALLAHFGEDLGADCGNCDTCLEPPETWDATVAAQKLLSCIYRTGQRFGAVHVINVLLGRDQQKIRDYGHDRLSTYGIGEDHSEAVWRSVVRQLLVGGYIDADPEAYGALKLTGLSRALLKGETRLQLRRESLKSKPRKTSGKSSREIVEEADEPLWDALRDCRKSLADEQSVPPYVIFHDSTLLEMLKLKPATETELLAVTGVGQTKLERYGEAFLKVLANSTATA